jgi:hypothetical protein
VKADFPSEVMGSLHRVRDLAEDFMSVIPCFPLVKNWGLKTGISPILDTGTDADQLLEMLLRGRKKLSMLGWRIVLYVTVDGSKLFAEAQILWEQN